MKFIWLLVPLSHQFDYSDNLIKMTHKISRNLANFECVLFKLNSLEWCLWQPTDDRSLPVDNAMIKRVHELRSQYYK